MSCKTDIAVKVVTFADQKAAQLLYPRVDVSKLGADDILLASDKILLLAREIKLEREISLASCRCIGRRVLGRICDDD